jgi:MFS family permease
MNPLIPPQKPQRLVFIVGLSIGLSILGDSFLYGNLPIEAENLGIALPLVGVLLSANRLVRLVSNTWASSLYEKLGPRKPFIAATVVGLLSTALYGAGWGFTVFLLARMAWGIAWSALRQGGYQAVWTAGQYGKGRMMGLLWGMIRLGSAFSVVFGGYLRDLWGYRAGVLGVLGISALAIPVAASIAWPAEAQRITPSKQTFWQGWREALKTGRGRRLLLAASLNSLFEGVLIATASLFLARRLGAFDFLSGLGIRVGTIAGLLLALRWTSDILFAPLIGWLSDHLGPLRSLALLVCVLLVSLIGAVNSRGALLFFCLAFLFVSSAGLYVTLNALANGLSTQMERPHIYLGVYATAADGGSALGPLLAYSAGALMSFAALYLVAGAMLTAAVFRFCWLERKESV